MSFIENLASIGSNFGLSKLAPSNKDAIRDSYQAMTRNNRDAKIVRNANRDGRTYTDARFLDEANDSLDKARLAKEGSRLEEKHALDALAKRQVASRHQQALGRSADSSTRDGSTLSKEQLEKFREANNEVYKNHKAVAKKASKDLQGHAKDYFFSGDLGTNALRWGAAGVAYGGASIGMRTISGGSATTNNQGQRDIAGIPFI